MKITAGRVTAVLAIAAGTLWAQGAGAQRPRRGGMAAGQLPGQRLDRLAKYLNLSAGQVAQAKDVFSAARQQLKELAPKLRTARQDLLAAERTNAPNLQQVAGAHATLVAQAMAIRQQAEQKFQALLTSTQAEQYAKLKDLRKGNRGAGAMRGQGRRGAGAAGLRRNPL